MTFDPIPQARVVKKAGRVITGAPAPKDEPARGSATAVLKDCFAIAMGMWPLTACVLLVLGLLVMAGSGGNFAYYR
jgi:hypothetical protein